MRSTTVRTLLLAAGLVGATACRRPEPAPLPPPAPPLEPAPSLPPAEPLPPEVASEPAPPAPPEDATVAIEHLLATIASSPLVFLRNGSEYTGKRAADHIRSKYVHYKKDIATAEDFIVKAATKSELSGKPYKVRLADGKEVELAAWLTERLAEWRAQPR